MQALFAISEKVNSKQLPDIIGAPGLPLPQSNTMLTANAQFRRDGDDPATIAGSSISAEPVVPTPSGLQVPAAPLQMQFTAPMVPASSAGIGGEGTALTPSATNVAAVEPERAGTTVPGTEQEMSTHDDVDMCDEVPFIPPP